MESVYFIASFWFLLAVVSSIIAYYAKLSIALVEICVGVITSALLSSLGLPDLLKANSEWVKFLASSGSILLTFLAGAELEPTIIRKKLKEVSLIGFVGFLSPFLGCAIIAHFILGWDYNASLLAGIALSTTSMAVVYAVMLETGFNKTSFGKSILAACFINDLATVVALGLIFAPFNYKTLVFIGLTAIVLSILPFVSSFIRNNYGNRTAAIRTKWLLFILFALGGVAVWSGSEAVLPAYLTGMVLAEFSNEDNFWLRRFRTLTVGFLTPIYFIRAGSFVKLADLLRSPYIFIVLLLGKVGFKIFGLYPVIGMYYKNRDELWFYTLMMSTGLTFGTISALYGYTHGIIDQSQYSNLVAVVIGSAVVPTMIAGISFLPKHLLAEVELLKTSSLKHQEVK